MFHLPVQRLALGAAVVAGLLVTSARAQSSIDVFAKTTTGDPAIQSIDVIGFASQAVMLVGDGRGGQIFAVDTGDTKAAKSITARIEGIDAKLAGRLGTTAKNIEVLDLAVNPASGRAYVAVRKQDDKSFVVLTIDGEGKVGQFVFEGVRYARLPLPTGEKAPVTRITDVAWAGNKVLAAGRANEEFASKIFVIDAPLTHDKAGAAYSAETYHVSHGRWETKAPMSVLIPYKDADGQMYIVGAFTCTPVVKYPIAALKPGAKVKGVSMIELGSGNRPLDMFMYEKDGKPSVLTNTFRVFHKRQPFGPSPYWTARFDRDLLAGHDKVNEKAVHRVDRSAKPLTDRIQLVESYHGVVQMDRLDDGHALVLRQHDAGLDLEPVALP